MSTGIRSNNSTFTVGKATIIAETAVDLQNNSNGHIEELNHYAPNTPGLAELLKTLQLEPPKELVDEAIEQLKVDGSSDSLERSRLKQWFFEQGPNAASWAQFSVDLASLVFK